MFDALLISRQMHSLAATLEYSGRVQLYIIYRTSLIIGCNNAKEQYYDIYIYIFIYLFLKTNKLCFEIPSLCYMYFCYFKNQVINV